MRYILFGYYDYYPSGGINDIIGAFNSLEDALFAAQKDMVDGMKYDNYDIYDTNLNVAMFHNKTRWSDWKKLS